MANNSFETVLKSYNTEANNLIIESWKTAEAQQRNAFTLPHLFYVLANNQQIASVFEQLQYTPQQVQNFAQKSLDTVPAREGEMAYEQTLFSVLQQANIIAKADHSPETSPYHLLLSLLQSDHPLAQTLRQQGITPEKVQKLIVTKKKDTYMDKKEKADSSSFGEDLVALAKEGKLNPVIGRETEFRKLIEILSRKQKRNALILGEP
ncbi:MAG: hypothetical protein LBD75_04395 [Candidatus Peribacteria bacterium]|jgi:ATP-dependent Clp protease ATP-binding subunit ClpB|nr:hypothetical protein [Candidatus Peribacteria bacterium]